MIIGLLIFTFISMLLSIYWHIIGNVKLFSIFKPLTTLFIISLSAIIYLENQSFYSLVVLVSLLFCLAGDIFLIEYRYFIAGIASFMAAHVGFIVAFSSLYGFSVEILPLIFLLIISVSFYLFLFKSLAKFAIPVAVYIIVIVLMNWQGIGLLYSEFTTRNLLIAIGAIIFSISDSIIAINKFKVKFKASEPIILSTYWLAICLLVLAGIK